MPDIRWQKVFVSHDTADHEIVQPIYESLERIFEPYLAEREGKGGMRLARKIAANIEDSNVVVAILTQNSLISPWVNQEIGYAVCVRNHRNGEPLILPVLAPHVKPPALLEGIEGIQLVQDDLDETIHQLVKRLIEYVNRYWSNTITKIRVTCRKCDNHFDVALPSQRTINEAITSKRVITAFCRRCKTQNNLNPKTFIVAEHIPLA